MKSEDMSTFMYKNMWKS